MDMLISFLLKLVSFTLLFGVASLASAWALMRKFKPFLVVAIGTLASVLLLTAFLFLVAQIDKNQPVWSLIQQSMDEYWKTDLAPLLHGSGFTDENLNLWEPYFKRYFAWSFPAHLGISCLLVGFFSYYMTSMLLRKITTRVSLPLAFREWIVPEPLVFGLILGCFLKLFAPLDGPLDVLGDNLLVFYSGLYFIFGFSIVSFFFYKWKLSRLLRWLSYLIIMCSLPIIVTVCCLGVLDVWFDFRKIKSPPLEQPL